MTEPAPAPAVPRALAPHHLRLFALLVDYLLAVVLVNLLSKALLGARWDLRPEAVAASPWLALSVGALLVLGRDLPGGQSPGKWLTGLAVARADDPGSVPGPGPLVLRNVLLALLPVEAVLVFADAYYRRLGDRLAGTVVVAAGRPAPLSRRLLGLAIVFLGTSLGILLVEFWNVRRSAAYHAALAHARDHARVAGAYGAGVSFGGAPGLRFAPGGRRVVVTLDAEGEAGEGEVEVVLELQAQPRRWRLVEVRVRAEGEPAPRIEEAPAR